MDTIIAALCAQQAAYLMFASTFATVWADIEATFKSAGGGGSAI
jgi:hypothetical protein